MIKNKVHSIFARGDLLDVWASEEVGYGDKQGSNR